MRFACHIVPVEHCCSRWGLPAISYRLNTAALDEVCLPYRTGWTLLLLMRFACHIVPVEHCCSRWGLPAISYRLNTAALDEACLPRAVTKVSWNCSCINSFKKSSLFLRALEAPWRPSHWPNNQALPELFGRKINHAGHCNLGQWQIELSSVKRYFNLTLALTATSFRSKNFFLHTHKFVIVNVCLNGPTRYVSFHGHFY